MPATNITGFDEDDFFANPEDAPNGFVVNGEFVFVRAKDDSTNIEQAPSRPTTIKAFTPSPT